MQSPTDPNEAAIEITEVRNIFMGGGFRDPKPNTNPNWIMEVRNLFRDRAQKRKQAKQAKGIPGGNGGVQWSPDQGGVVQL